MRVAIISLVIFVNFILQITLFQWIAVMGISPNTALVLVVCYALLRNDIEGAIVGFFAGLLSEVFFGSSMGIAAFLLMMIGFVCGKPFKDFYKESYVAPIILVAVMSLANEFLFYVFNFLLQGGTNFPRYLTQIIIPTTVYNMLFCIFIYRLVYGIERFLQKRIEKSKNFK